MARVQFSQLNDAKTELRLFVTAEITLEAWFSGICACLRVCLMCARTCMERCVSVVCHPGVYPGVRSWSKKASLAAAGECQQM